MIKIGVISDSHWDSVHVVRFLKKAREEGISEIIHCGDGVSDAKWLGKKLDIPVESVSGNCDPPWSGERELRLSREQVRLLVVHGDQYGVKYDQSRLSYHGEETGAQVILYGHTHFAFAGMVGRTMMINPGALKDGRYAILEINGKDAVPFLKSL